jgi:hypothetical protein
MSVPALPPFRNRKPIPMTVKMSSIKNNIAAESAGEYIEIPEWTGVSLGVRSLELPAYKIALDQLVQRYARKYKGKTAPPDVRDSDIGKLLAIHILYDWKGFDEPYSESYANEFLSAPEGRELAKQVLWAAAQVAETNVEFVKDAVKNSLTPSVTN